MRRFIVLSAKFPARASSPIRPWAFWSFPSVIKAGIGFGGEYGEGILLNQQRVVGYYNLISASFGFQLGVQQRSVIIMFMTQDALAGFEARAGWKVGVDGSVTIITVGVGGAIDSDKVVSPVIGFILDQKGLMYNLTLEGLEDQPHQPLTLACGTEQHDRARCDNAAQRDRQIFALDCRHRRFFPNLTQMRR